MTPEELSERLWKFAARVGKVVDGRARIGMPLALAGAPAGRDICRTGVQ